MDIMKSSKNIVLIGFMGAGKSSVARVLSKQTGWPCVSTDDLIVQVEGRSVNDIFRDAGESYFRDVELRVVSEVAQRQGVIIDCGGGVVLDPRNVAVLRKTGTVFYLQASAVEIYRRVKADTQRPLLRTPDPQMKIKELLDTRAPLYAQADHIVITDNRTPQQVGQEILALSRS
jgi:shikimate kinase